jgi:hypothetical protein
MQRRQFRAENLQTLRRDPVRPPPLLGWKRFNPSLLFEACDGPIQRPWSQPRAAQAGNVFDHRVPVLRSSGKAGKHQQRWVRVVADSRRSLSFYYVTRTTHDVVIAQVAHSCKEFLEVVRQPLFRGHKRLRHAVRASACGIVQPLPVLPCRRYGGVQFRACPRVVCLWRAQVPL